ncbi:TPA: hypothetical protein ACWZT8_004776, partial [Escherichia coli]
PYFIKPSVSFPRMKAFTRKAKYSDHAPVIIFRQTGRLSGNRLDTLTQTGCVNTGEVSIREENFSFTKEIKTL